MRRERDAALPKLDRRCECAENPSGFRLILENVQLQSSERPRESLMTIFYLGRAIGHYPPCTVCR